MGRRMMEMIEARQKKIVFVTNYTKQAFNDHHKNLIHSYLTASSCSMIAILIERVLSHIRTCSNTTAIFQLAMLGYLLEPRSHVAWCC